MAILKQRSVKLPILVALPVLLVIGVSAVFLIPSDPAPQPAPPNALFPNDEPGGNGDDGDPLPPDPRPRALPKPDAPDDVAVAKAMEAEAEAAMEAIRSRLELKYNNSDHTLDRTWTLQQVMRSLGKLAGTHFDATDYALSFPEGAEQLAVITCATIKGRALPDGPLTLQVDLRTGKSSREGRIIARNADGFVLLGDVEYRYISEVLSVAVQAHLILQTTTASGLASLDAPFGVPPEALFALTDFSAKPVKGAPLSAEFACHSMRGEPLAQPATITINYKTRAVTVSATKSPSWMELPDDREDFKRSTRWLLREVAEQVLAQVGAGTPQAELTPEKARGESWLWGHALVLPFDVKLIFEADKPDRVVLEIATCFGRALPFAAVRYVADASTGTWAFEEK